MREIGGAGMRLREGNAMATQEEILKQHNASRWSAAQQREFDEINERATTLGKKLKIEDFDKDGNPTGAWAKILAEFDAWAKKHKVEFKTTERKRPPATSAGGGPVVRTHHACPGTTTSTETFTAEGHGKITIKTTCTLRRQGIILDRCIYSCVGSFV